MLTTRELFRETGARMGLPAALIEKDFWVRWTSINSLAWNPCKVTSCSKGGTSLSRHFYDVAMMTESAIKNQALVNKELLAQVVRHKTAFYFSKWARYDLAVPGSFCLTPPQARLTELRRDYEAMKVMIFGEPPAFDTILAVLDVLEKEINQIK